MKEQVMFFAHFSWTRPLKYDAVEHGQSDRREIFTFDSADKVLDAFHDWLETARDKVEYSNDCSAVITNCQIIKV